MNWKKIKAIIGLGVFALFIVGAGVGAILVQKNQDTRQQASGGCEFMTQTDKVPGLYAKIMGNQVGFCDPDGGEYTILVKYNDKPIDQEKILEETKTFSPGEVIVYNNSCPPPDANYKGNIAININLSDKDVTKGWGHVYVCSDSFIQPDLNPEPLPTTSPQTPENAEVTVAPTEQTPTPSTLPTQTPTNTPTTQPTNTPTPTNSTQPTQAAQPTSVPLVTDAPEPTVVPQTTGADCNESCSFNADCDNSLHICADTSVGKRCRLATDPDSLLCVVLGDPISPFPTQSGQNIEPTITPLPQCRADLNKDGFVDLSDYMLIRDRFLKRGVNQASDIALADVDKDGIVDLVDYSILVQEFFMRCQN